MYKNCRGNLCKMIITYKTYIIICPLVFLAGFVDSIGGGGGLISLPAYLLAGLPTHISIATNKLSAAMGTTVTTGKFIKERLINVYIAIPTIIAALIGSSIGAKLSLITGDNTLKVILIPVLIITSFFVFNKNVFGKEYPPVSKPDKNTIIIASVSALVIGAYDGFYGPGTGTFLIILLNIFAHLSLSQANAQTKAINLTTNVTSLVIFLINGQVIVKLGLIAGIFGIAGNLIGANLAIKKSTKITRPIITLVLVLLFIKIIFC